MTRIIEVVFEQGVLRPAVPAVGFHEGQHVWVSVSDSVTPPSSSLDAREAELIRRLDACGLLEKLAVPPLPGCSTPLLLPGPGLSETILEERG